MRYLNKNDLLIITHNIGRLMIGIGVLCLVPIIIDLIYFEFNVLAYLIPSFISISLGFLIVNVLKKYDIDRIRLKHAMIVSSLSWIWAGLICGLSLYICTDMGMLDSFFECMSALTGSGITLYSDVEVLPQSVLFFRGFQQWVGGLGVVVLIVYILTKPGIASSRLYQSEAREDRIKPSIKATLNQTIKIYLIFTGIGILLYCLAGMPVFDSVCNTFSIISTGGMSIKNANIGFYQSDLIYVITMILMIMGATSFLIHYKVIKTHGKSLINDLQFRVMICIIVIASLLIYLTSSIVPMDILFTVVSAITTTGASVQSSTVMAGWPPFTIFIIIVLMLMGGSAGSTVGAIKLIRIISFFKGIYKNLREIWSPEGAVVPVHKNKEFTEKMVTQSGNYITLYFLFILITWSVLCLYGHDPLNSLFYTCSLQGNIGLEIGQISLTLEWPIKLLAILNMWTGRLEIYPVLITIRALFEIFKR